jgi:hypothetical protein
MKIFSLLFVVCICGVASAQSVVGHGALNPQPQMITMPDYAEHASQVGLGREQSLFERAGSASARGERPLWEVVPPSVETPLGDTARELRKEHASAKKAVRIWTN